MACFPLLPRGPWIRAFPRFSLLSQTRHPRYTKKAFSRLTSPQTRPTVWLSLDRAVRAPYPTTHGDHLFFPVKNWTPSASGPFFVCGSDSRQFPLRFGFRFAHRLSVALYTFPGGDSIMRLRNPLRGERPGAAL